MANGITRYSLHPEVVQLIFGQLLRANDLFFKSRMILSAIATVRTFGLQTYGSRSLEK